MTDELPSAIDDALADLPPSAKYVKHVLEDVDGNRVTRQELLERVALDERTVDRALERLQNVDYIDKTRDNKDLRQVVVML